MPKQAENRTNSFELQNLPDGQFYNKNSIAKIDVICFDYLDNKKGNCKANAKTAQNLFF